MTGDFEICPVGTIAELARLKKLVEELHAGTYIVLPTSKKHAQEMGAVAEFVLKNPDVQ